MVFEHARKYTIMHKNIGLTSTSHRLIVYFRHIKNINPHIIFIGSYLYKKLNLVVLINTINKILRKKEDILAIIIIFLLSLFFFKDIISTEKLMNNGHYLHEQTFFIYNYKVALGHGTLPFWTPYW